MKTLSHLLSLRALRPHSRSLGIGDTSSSWSIRKRSRTSVGLSFIAISRKNSSITEGRNDKLEKRSKSEALPTADREASLLDMARLKAEVEVRDFDR